MPTGHLAGRIESGSEGERAMDQSLVPKTFNVQLRPTPPQQRAGDEVLSRWRTRYPTAHDQRSALWQQRGAARSRDHQEAEGRAIQARLPEYAATPAPAGRRGGGP